MKSLIKAISPPFLLEGAKAALRPLRPITDGFEGDFPSFAAALAAIGNRGYEEEYVTNFIVESAKVSLAQRQRGEWPVFLDGLVQKAAMPLLLAYARRRDPRAFTVLDFGGAVGGYYFHLKDRFDEPSVRLRWNVCELPDMVARCKPLFADGQLDYIDDLDKVPDGAADVVLASGSLQYVPDPEAFLRKLARKADSLIIHRIQMHDGARDRVAIQRVDKKMYGRPVSFPIFLFSESKMLGLLRELGFEIELRWLLPENTVMLDGKLLPNQGLFATRG